MAISYIWESKGNRNSKIRVQSAIEMIYLTKVLPILRKWSTLYKQTKMPVGKTILYFLFFRRLSYFMYIFHLDMCSDYQLAKTSRTSKSKTNLFIKCHSLLRFAVHC